MCGIHTSVDKYVTAEKYPPNMDRLTFDIMAVSSKVDLA